MAAREHTISCGRRSKLLYGALGLCIGAVAGVGCSWWWFESSLLAADTLQALYWTAWEQEQAMAPYLARNFESGTFALNHVIRVLEKYEERQTPGIPVGVDLALAYTRLGLLAEAAGDNGGASEAFSRGLEVARKSDPKIESVTELKDLVQQIDESFRKHRQGAGPPEDTGP